MGLFWSKRRQQPETKALGLTDPATLELFGAVPTSAGIQVGPGNALRVPAVAAAIGLIAETVGSLGIAIGDLERTVNGQMIRQGGHAVLRHHFDSVVASRNATGLVRMHKARKTDRIDGAVATAMAVSRACAGDSMHSAYNAPESEGLFSF